jgi:hypothetical protein
VDLNGFAQFHTFGRRQLSVRFAFEYAARGERKVLRRIGDAECEFAALKSAGWQGHLQAEAPGSDVASFGFVDHDLCDLCRIIFEQLHRKDGGVVRPRCAPGDGAERICDLAGLEAGKIWIADAANHIWVAAFFPRLDRESFAMSSSTGSKPFS